MVAHSMAFGLDALVNIRVLHYIFTNTKKRCLCVIPFQLFQYPGCNNRVRAVVKGQVNRMIRTWEIPGVLAKKLLYQPGCFYKEAMHGVKLEMYACSATCSKYEVAKRTCGVDHYDL